MIKIGLVLKGGVKASAVVTDHASNDRMHLKEDSKEVKRLPNGFNEKVFKEIVETSKDRLFDTKWLGKKFVVTIPESNSDKSTNISFLMKLEYDKFDVLSLVVISSITTESILPYRKISVHNRFSLNYSYKNVMIRLEAKRKQQEKSIEEQIIVTPPKRTGLKIVKKKAREPRVFTIKRKDVEKIA